MKKLLLAFVVFGVASFAQAPFEVKITGHGKAMILIPGLSSSGETWDTTVDHYKDRFECHVLTLAGFAGVPRIDATPMLGPIRDAIAGYIQKNKLEKPVLVGHSLGGFLALDLASKYPDLVGRLVIVDAYPFLAAVTSPGATVEQAKANAEQLRKAIRDQSQDDYERYVKSGVGMRLMVTSDADFDRIVAWGLASDRTAVADGMAELLATDLRDAIAAIKSPTLVMASWIGYKQFTDRARTQTNLESQYARLKGVEIEINDTARHFIMWDDPSWMFQQLDRFLRTGTAVSTR